MSHNEEAAHRAEELDEQIQKERMFIVDETIADEGKGRLLLKIYLSLAEDAGSKHLLGAHVPRSDDVEEARNSSIPLSKIQRGEGKQISAKFRELYELGKL